MEQRVCWLLVITNGGSQVSHPTSNLNTQLFQIAWITVLSDSTSGNDVTFEMAQMIGSVWAKNWLFHVSNKSLDKYNLIHLLEVFSSRSVLTKYLRVLWSEKKDSHWTIGSGEGLESSLPLPEGKEPHMGTIAVICVYM